MLPMLLSLLSVIVFLAFLCLAVWAVRALVVAFGVADPWATVVYIVAAVLIIAITYLPQVTHLLPFGLPQASGR